MCIAIEGPALKGVNFDQVLDIYKEQNHRIAFEAHYVIVSISGGGGGGHMLGGKSWGAPTPV